MYNQCYILVEGYYYSHGTGFSISDFSTFLSVKIQESEIIKSFPEIYLRTGFPKLQECLILFLVLDYFQGVL